MAHSAANPVASQPAKTHSDWLTILGSALFDGLKAYGAALMMVSAPSLPVLETWETKTNSPKPGAHASQVARPQLSPTLHLTKPTWRHA